MTSPLPAGYRFGPYILDLEAAELRRGSEKLPARPKCLDLLRHLVENPRRLITKEALLDAVWSDAVVIDATLSRTIAELRSLLDDDPKNPRYIETVARRGYKFIAESEIIAAGGAVGVRKQADYVLLLSGNVYPLAAGDTVIGRDFGATIPLPGLLVSRRHARIHVEGMTVTVEDLGSRNGTFVNDQKIAEPLEIKPGDKIRIGELVMMLWWSNATKTAPGSHAIA
jgi:DNA-binding winged helix-turn-helix (wHTH) protein